MPTPSLNENRGDQEQLSHAVDARQEGLTKIQENIESKRGWVRNAFGKVLGASKTVLNYAGITNSEAEYHNYYDLPSEKRTSWSWKEAKNHAVSGKFSADDLAKIDNPGNFDLKAEVTLHYTGPPPYTRYMMLNIPIDFSKMKWDQSEDELKKYINSNRNDVDKLAAIGIGIQEGQSLTAAQGEAIAVNLAKHVAPYRANFRNMLLGEGVDLLNARMAQQFAVGMDQGKLSDLLSGGDEKTKKEIDSLNTKDKLNKALSALAALRPGEAGYVSAKAIDTELAAISADLDNLDRGIGRSGSRALTPPITFKKVPPDRHEKIQNLLLRKQEEAVQARKPYDAIESALKAFSKLTDPTKVITTLDNLIDRNAAPPKVKTDQLKPDMDLEALVKDWRTVLDIPEKDYAAEKGILQAKMKLSGSEAKSGVDAVMAIYQAHLKAQGRSDRQAELEALQMFNDNKLSDPNVKHDVRSIVERDILRVGMKKEKLGMFGWFAQQGKEMWYGTEESFISNLANAAGVDSSYGKVFDSTRRLGFLWHKGNARPSWGNLKNEELLTTFLALREAVQQKHLSRESTTTSYVREQLVEVAGLLATRSMDQAWRNYFKTKGSKPATPEGGHAPAEESKAAQFAAKVANLNGDIEKLLKMEIPEDEKVKVQHLIDTAAANTGWKRRALGGAVGTVVATPASFAYESAKGTASLANDVLLQTPKNAIGGIMSGVRASLGFVWDKATERRNFLTGEKAAGSSASAPHGAH
ncbi:hypothetical protein EXS70_01005 [Candidatus Peribacteria bacterium]|nr:hypothetical protein [Candidatus Peribacteria bacterium]